MQHRWKKPPPRDDAEVLKAEKLATLEDDIRRILREVRIGYRFSKSGDNAINVSIRDPDDVPSAKQKLEELTRPVTGGLFGNSQLREVEMSEPSTGVIRMTLTEEGIENSISHAVSQSQEVIRRRVDELLPSRCPWWSAPSGFCRTASAC